MKRWTTSKGLAIGGAIALGCLIGLLLWMHERRQVAPSRIAFGFTGEVDAAGFDRYQYTLVTLDWTGDQNTLLSMLAKNECETQNRVAIGCALHPGTMANWVRNNVGEKWILAFPDTAEMTPATLARLVYVEEDWCYDAVYGELQPETRIDGFFLAFPEGSRTPTISRPGTSAWRPTESDMDAFLRRQFGEEFVESAVAARTEVFEPIDVKFVTVPGLGPEETVLGVSIHLDEGSGDRGAWLVDPREGLSSATPVVEPHRDPPGYAHGIQLLASLAGVVRGTALVFGISYHMEDYELRLYGRRGSGAVWELLAKSFHFGC